VPRASPTTELDIVEVFTPGGRVLVLLRSADPGGGGGFVRGLVRGGGSGAAAAGAGGGVTALGFGVGVWTGAGGGGSPPSPSSDQPDAKSAMRLFVSSPRRRRVLSSSGTV
jgi:hypothetical protein